MVYQVFNLSPIFRRQTITGRIRYIDYRSSCLDNSFYYTRQIFVVRTTGIFRIELYIVYKTTGIFHRTLDNFFTIRVELIFNVWIGSADTCMNTFMLCKSQRIDSYINIFLNSTGQSTDSRPSHRFRNFNYWIKVTRAWNGKSGFNHVYPQQFQCLCYLNLFHCIQLASRNLFAIPKGGIKNK